MRGPRNIGAALRLPLVYDALVNKYGLCIPDTDDDDVLYVWMALVGVEWEVVEREGFKFHLKLMYKDENLALLGLN